MYKLGKLPAKPRLDAIQLHDVVGPDGLKTAPHGFGHWEKVASIGEQWGMLGNDQYGDCVWAGSAHETMLWKANSNEKVPFTPESVLSDYSAVTGFNPNDPNSDQGTDMHVAMEYRKSTGILDANGNRHKIGAFVSLEPGNYTQMLEALYAFDAVAIGFQVPDYAMAEFQRGLPWIYFGSNNIVGGHYVPVLGHAHREHMIQVCTWGTIQLMGRKFYEELCDEAYGIVTPEALNQSGVTPEGLDMDALNAALHKL